MRRLLSAVLALALLGGWAGRAGEAKLSPLLVCPAPVAEWRADIQNVQHVLTSAARELWRFFPERTLPPIIVAPKGGPIVWFQRGINGEYFIQLDTGGSYWSQYAYQFAHEFCHVLCNYTGDEKSNKWLEESICEVASLFALRGMAATWAKTPPYPNWRDFAPNHRKYADDRLASSKLPPETTFVEWFRQNEAAMRKDACIREKNNVVAAALLPLFEKQPEHWEAVTWLNAQPSRAPRTLAEHLTAWRSSCPPKHRPFVAELARVFGISLPAE